MDIVKQWKEIVFKLLHQGYDSLSKEEIKDLDTYFGWKVKTTLKGKRLMCIIPEGEKGWFHIVDDLRGIMIMYILEKKEQLINLEPDLLWKKFNNHAYRYLQYQYWKKSMRETQFQVGDSTQRTKEFSEEELERDPTLRPAQRVSGWSSKLSPVKNRMAEKQTIVRRRAP